MAKYFVSLGVIDIRIQCHLCNILSKMLEPDSNRVSVSRAYFQFTGNSKDRRCKETHL